MSEQEISYELSYSTAEGEWRDYGRTQSLEAARTVVKEMRENTTFKVWEIKKVTITVETIQDEVVLDV